MIGAGWYRALSRLGQRAVLAAGLAGLPDLGQQRTLSTRPGSGIVRRSGPAPRRKDGARQAAALAKRQRKDAKRVRDAQRLANGQECAWFELTRGCYGF